MKTPRTEWESNGHAAGAMAVGLGARDTLRLEVCYPLHGNDIGPETDAISAVVRPGRTSSMAASR